MTLSNKLYDILKWGVMIALPATATLYAALSGVWGFPHTQEVVTSITAVTTFLGTLLGISTARYHNKSGK